MIQSFNFVTMTEYSGRNAALLSYKEFPAFATYRQIESLGGSVNKGEHGTHIFCGYQEKLDKKTGETVRVPKSATVFHISQCAIPEDYEATVYLEQQQGKIKPCGVEIDTRIMAALA